MPVKFYPSKPIDLLEKFITHDDGTPLRGEIDIYRKLHTDLSQSKHEWHVWHDLKLPKHSEVVNDYNKTSAQLDFLILSKFGILVLEVKGGHISFKENAFYYGRNFENKMPQDPFRQAEGYKFSLKDTVLNSLGKCFFCHAVAFPHMDYPFESKIHDGNILWTKFTSTNYNHSLENFIESVFEHSIMQHRRYNRIYPNLAQLEIDAARKILSPILNDSSKYDSINTLEWLQINNIEILEGLYKNNRIMIEGPPGSGKTTLAMAYIDKQIGKKGLYLCWNNLLMHYIKQLFEKRSSIEETEVTTFIRFLRNLNPEISLNSLLNLTEERFYDLLKASLSTLEAQGLLPSYDFIVIDEGQDVFDRGLDLLINKLCGYNRSGLSTGNALVLYDIDQSYTSTGRNLLEISDLLKEYFSHFKLNEVKRSAQNPDIRALAQVIFDAPQTLLNKNYMEGYKHIFIRRFNNLEEVKKYIVAGVLTQIRTGNSSLRGGQCVLLLESVLLKETFRDELGMNYWLTIKDVEELNEHNILDKGNKLRYTSILKFKGLEKENVFLVITEPNDRNKYELYVGITRAINNLEILIVA
jgi:hypothetical protein